MQAIDNRTKTAYIWRPNAWILAAALLAAVATALLPALVRPPAPPLSDIRVRNASSIDFENVVINHSNYGTVKSGETTGYQRWGPAYRYARVELYAAGKKRELQPEDYVGESPLGTGRFTYVLSIPDAKSGYPLEIYAERD